MKIIIVEDDSSLGYLTQRLLYNSGYQSEVYLNERILFSEEYEIPQLYLIDNRLPGVIGIKVCKHLKSREKTKHLPVIIISAAGNLHDEFKAAGADDYLEKPFEPAYLIGKVNSCLKKYSADIF